MDQQSPREIDPDETNIPAGWPRPFYVGADGKPKPVQYITAHAASQIMHCNSDRTYTAGLRFACSSCAELLTMGYLVDLGWQDQRRGTQNVHPNRMYDGHYGSPLCARCAVFALATCPYFSSLDTEFGDDLTWVQVTGADDYCEPDETSVLALTQQAADRPRMTTSQLRAAVASKDYGHAGAVLTPDDLLIRPPDAYISYDPEPPLVLDSSAEPSARIA